jgi:uncharacterized protein YgbK (DUF1537 family)
MHNPRLGLIADDLTGACDAGVQFAQRGFASLVRLDPQPREHGTIDLAILTTNSRNDLPDLARVKVRQACQLLLQEQRELVCKKIDSTLRGNLGAEIEAAMENCAYSLAVVAPAFPAMGRTIAGGWLRVAGEAPANSVHLPTLLRQQGAENVIHLDRALLMDGSVALTDRLEKICAAAQTIVIPDAESQQDLAVIAQAATEVKRRVLLVGSAALAAEVAAILAAKYQRQSPPAPEGTVRKSPAGSVVLILGSGNPITAAQVNHLVANRRVAIIPCQTSGFDVARRALKENRHLILNIHVGRDDAQHLGEFLTILADSAVHGVILSGGDTAELVCRALKATGIKLEREIAPGIPRGRFVGGHAEGMAIATKAGGFGEENSLVVMTDFLATREASRT